MRFFNTAGPCRPDDHYMLPAAARLAEANVRRLIEQKAYFVVHAPRQTGKTTAMLELADTLNQSGQYVAVMMSMEVGAGLPHDVGAAEAAILQSWREDAEFQLTADRQPPDWPVAPAGQRIGSALRAWAMVAPMPLVIFLDEIDALEHDALISVLRQLRVGYRRRPDAFPASLALVGLRDVRDYKVASGGSDRLHTPSPFNIAVRSITLRNFSDVEVSALLQQHTEDTGQVFTPEARDLVFDLTQGQPWLINALAQVAIEELVPDPAQSITPTRIHEAKEMLIVHRQTHLDQLTDKLRQPRVRRVMEPILAGETLGEMPEDDRDYVVDLGLVRRENGGGLVIANPIYREVIPRALASGPQDSLPEVTVSWLTDDGKLDPDRLLDAFLDFWRQHGQPLLASAPYHEIAPHLVFMAFLHRVINGGGTMTREYAIGTGRIDLYLRYGDVQMAIEIKVWRDGKPDPLQPGLVQLDTYLNGLSLETGWLVIFDQRRGQPDISERTATEAGVTPAGRAVTVVRG